MEYNCLMPPTIDCNSCGWISRIFSGLLWGEGGFHSTPRIFSASYSTRRIKNGGGFSAAVITGCVCG